jgi:hypothetical protein
MEKLTHQEAEIDAQETKASEMLYGPGSTASWERCVMEGRSLKRRRAMHIVRQKAPSRTDRNGRNLWKTGRKRS